jgi:hypothetical protein
MGFDDAHQNVHPLGHLLLPVAQHGVGFPDARGGTKKNLEASALARLLRLLHLCQQGIRIGSSVFAVFSGHFFPLGGRRNRP